TGIRILGEVAMTNCSVATAGEISSPRHSTLIPTSQLHFIAFSLSQGMQLSCLPGVVAAQRLDLVSKRPARERVEQMCERWMRLEVGGRHDEIVTGGLDWDEIQSEQLRGRSNADADIRVMACNGTSHVNMRPQNCVVALYPGRVWPRGAQTLVEQKAGARSLLTIDHSHVRLGEISRLVDPFWIAGSNEKSFLPGCEGHDVIRRPFQDTFQEGQVGFPARRIEQVKPRHMNFSSLQRLQRRRAAHGPTDHRALIFLATQMFSCEENGGIASGHGYVAPDQLPIAGETHPGFDSRRLREGIEQISVRRNRVRQHVAKSVDRTNDSLCPNRGDFDAERNRPRIDRWWSPNECPLDHLISLREAEEIFHSAREDRS